MVIRLVRDYRYLHLLHTLSGSRQAVEERVDQIVTSGTEYTRKAGDLERVRFSIGSLLARSGKRR